MTNGDQGRTIEARLWAVRHGQTDWNLEGRFQGHADQPLNATGLSQAQQLAKQLSKHIFSAIYSSDLQRARQTADILSQQFNLPVYLDSRLREISQGEWEGVLFAELVSRHAEEMERRRTDPLSARPPGGESAGEVAERMWAAADDITLLYPNQDVLVVSHGLAIATLIARGRGIPLTQVYNLIPENTCAEVITWTVATSSTNGRTNEG